jgi:hypothetical protein
VQNDRESFRICIENHRSTQSLREGMSLNQFAKAQLHQHHTASFASQCRKYLSTRLHPLKMTGNSYENIMKSVI